MIERLERAPVWGYLIRLPDTDEMIAQLRRDAAELEYLPVSEHGYTCGRCYWGRSSDEPGVFRVKRYGEYVDHMRRAHNVEMGW